MEILLLLLPLSVVLVFVIGAAFWWSVDSGQFDDLDSPAYRVVADDDAVDPALPRADLERAATDAFDADQPRQRRSPASSRNSRRGTSLPMESR